MPRRRARSSMLVPSKPCSVNTVTAVARTDSRSCPGRPRRREAGGESLVVLTPSTAPALVETERSVDNSAPSTTRRPAVPEVFLVGGVRTPHGRYGGSLASMRPDDLAALVVGEVVRRTGIPPEAVD